MIDLPKPAPPTPEITPQRRRWAVRDMWLKDHGIIRAVFANWHQVSDKVWRSAQPLPKHLYKAKDMGIKTILNLRGYREHCGSYVFEQEVCEKLGLTLIDFPMRSRQTLERETMLAAVDLLPTLEYPILLHCKSGADRAGFMSTMYLFLQEGVPLREAMEQLNLLPYGHLKQARTGIIDYFFECFLQQTDGKAESFRPWVEKTYDPQAIFAEFNSKLFAGFVVDNILRRE